jgi:septal ring factor EnvC (AmiA/AmiB activator)
VLLPLATVLLALAQAPEPSVSPSSDPRLRQVQERRRGLEREIARLRGEERSLLGEVEALELEVRLRGEEIREIQLTLQAANRQLDETVKRLRSLEASLQAMRPALAARARALYKMGELSYLRLLLSVDRPGDFVRGYRFVTTLARGDRDRVARFRAEQREATAARTALETQTREAVALRGELDAARRRLDADRRRKTARLTEIVERKETQAEYLRELTEAEGRLTEMIGGLGAGEVTMPLGAFRGALPWPVAGTVRAGFGRRKHPRFDTYTVQNGLEIDAPLDTPVRAVHEGTVAFADVFRGYGLMVILDHGGQRHSLYAHLGDASVTVGQRVAAGQELGRVGGSSLGGPGLHFEVRVQGRPEDPLDWLGPLNPPAKRRGAPPQ